MEKGLYYLAGPHKGTPEQEAHRVETCLKLTGAFLAQGIHVFSPIVYSSKLIEGLNISSSEERRCLLFTYLLDFLKVSKGMILVTMEGWKESWGAQQELKFCQENHIPIYRVDPNKIPDDLSQVLSKPLDQGQIKTLMASA